MSNASSRENEMTVGLDVGDKYVHACFLDSDGNIVEESRLATTAVALRRRLGGEERYRVVLEAGLHSPWMSRLLAELGHEVYVANPRRLRAIYLNESKSDRVDAQYLARIGRLDPALLFPLRHRSAETQADLAILRSRAMIVKARSMLIQYVRGVVKSAGGRIPHCDARGFARKAALHLPAELAPVLSPVVATIAAMDATIHAYDKQIEQMAAERYPETQLLQQVAGVGAITAATFVLTVEDPTRFVRSRSIGSYLGLRPRQDESGTISCASPRLETSTCARFWSAVPNTSSDTLGPTPTFVVGDCASLSGAARTERSGRSSRWRASSQYSSYACG